MTDNFKFGASNIYELGHLITAKLREYGVEGEAELKVVLPNDKFSKVEEDMFYRVAKGEGEFVPSDKFFNIDFDGLKVIVEKNG